MANADNNYNAINELVNDKEHLQNIIVLHVPHVLQWKTIGTICAKILNKNIILI